MNGVPQGSILGPLLFLFFINDLPRIMQNKAEPVLFADDTSIIIKNSCLTAFRNEIATVFVQLNEWFNKILLSLNYENTHYIQFMTKNSTSLDINIGLNNKFITNVSKTKFLGIVIESTLSWKAHV
jgi:protein associated with RNAse G/E